MRNTTSQQRLLWINTLGSVYSFQENGETVFEKTKAITLHGSEDVNDYFFEFESELQVRCLDCKLEVIISEFGYEFHRELETVNFIFFINREEGDENGNAMMFRKETMECVSNNYFANIGFMEAIAGKDNDPILWMSEELQNNIKEYPEMSEDTIPFHQNYDEIDSILSRKKEGIDCNEEQSSVLKGFIKDTAHLNSECPFLKSISELFPCEWSESFMETCYTISDIEYDTDGEDYPTLPKEIKVVVNHNEYSTYEEIEEYLSDQISIQTGFCHKGFTTSPEIKENIS